MMDEMDAHGTSFQCLVEDNGSLLWDGFLKPRLDSGTSRGTLKNYLHSLQRFAKFVKAKMFAPRSLLPGDEYKVIVSLTERLNEYKKTIDRRTAAAHTKRQVAESLDPVKMEHLREFLRSEASTPLKSNGRTST